MPLPFMAQAAEPMDLIEGDPDVTQNNVENHQVYGATIDLELYSSAYTGLAKIYRLLYVADHCPPLKTEALLLAINYVKEKTFNCQIYQQIHQRLSIPNSGPANGGAVPDVAANQMQIPAYDNTWVEQTSKKGATKLEKLDTDLKHYKSNSIKESIRRGQDDLGEHYIEMGDLTNSLKCFSRARDYCTTNKHILAMCFNVIKVSVFLQNWSLVLSYVNRAESTADLAQVPVSAKEKDASRLQAITKLKCAAGLAELANKKYKVAARNFLQANFDHLDYPEVLSAANVAAYGSLCAMASFDRHELQKLVIGNTGFKQFLEVEPQLNDIVVKFYESKYAACLRSLDDIRENLMLDMYLAKHLNSLYAMIRNRGLIQYFSPYLSVDMNKMATAFNTTVPALEDELSKLILEGQIKARIDSHNKVLYAKDVDLKTSTYERALAIGKAQQQRTKTLILRAAMHKAHIAVKSPARSDSQGGAATPGNSANSSPTRTG